MPDLTDAELDQMLADIGLTEPRTRRTYVGAPCGRVTPGGESARVLGQIERQEIDTSADTARRIAARHQAAYGTAVWGDPVPELPPVQRPAVTHLAAVADAPKPRRRRSRPAVYLTEAEWQARVAARKAGAA